MEPIVTYTLRQDIVPFSQREPGRPLPEVRLFQFDNFDQAFLKMYQTPVDYYDEQIARSRNLSYAISSSIIYSTDPSEPLVRIARSAPYDTELMAGLNLSNTTIYIDKGNSHELLSPGLKVLFDKSDACRLEFPHIVIGVFKKFATTLSGVRSIEHDILFSSLKESMADRYRNPFSFEIKVLSLEHSQQLGIADGTPVTFSIASPDFRIPFLNLVSIDLDRFRSFNPDKEHNPSMIFGASVKERMGDNTIAFIRHVTADMVSDIRPDAGMYLQYTNLPMRYLAESQIRPLTKFSNDIKANALLLASVDALSSQLVPTEVGKQLRQHLSFAPDEEQLKRVFRYRSVTSNMTTKQQKL